MKKADVIYGPVDAKKFNWSAAAKALDKYFKGDNGTFESAPIKKVGNNLISKGSSTKGAYGKIGVIGNELILRVKQEGLLKSTHVGDVTLVDNIKASKVYVMVFDTLDYDNMLKLKATRAIFKEYANDPRKGAIGNELGFWEISYNKELSGDKKKKIYELYVKQDSKYMANISGGTRTKLDKLYNAQKYDELDFETAREEIHSMLRAKRGEMASALRDKNWNKVWK